MTSPCPDCGWPKSTADCMVNNCPSHDKAGPPAQAVEDPRNEAREWLDSCQTCKVVFPKGGYHNCPAVSEDREGDTEAQLARNVLETYVPIDGLGRKGMPLWDLAHLVTSAIQAKVESLEVSLAIAQDNVSSMTKIANEEREAKLAERAKLRALEGAARETPTGEATIRSLLCRAALRGWRRGRRNQDPAQEEIADDLLLEAGAAPRAGGADHG